METWNANVGLKISRFNANFPLNYAMLGTININYVNFAPLRTLGGGDGSEFSGKSLFAFHRWRSAQTKENGPAR